MTAPAGPASGLVPAGQNLPSSLRSQLPEILARAGKTAVFAAEEFFFGRIRNEHTRAAYLVAVRRFLRWAENRGLELRTITPKERGDIITVRLMKDSRLASAVFAESWTGIWLAAI